MIEHIPQWMMLLFVFFYASVITSFLCLAVDRLPHQLKWREEADENLRFTVLLLIAMNVRQRSDGGD